MQTPKHGDAIWENARLLSMADGLNVVDDAAIAVQGGRIVFAGAAAELPELTVNETHDAGGALITPALIDCHTHLVYGGNRAKEFEMRLAGASYIDIANAGGGIISTVKATRKASEDELFAQSEKRLRNLLREGVTTVEIKSGYGLDAANEMKMLRVARRLGQEYPVNIRTTFLGAHALPPEFKGRADDYVAYVCEEMLPACAEARLVDAVDGFCETIGFTNAQMRRVFETARKYGLPVKLHAEQLSDQCGAELVAEFGGLSADHVEFVGDAGARAMAKAGVVATLLPAAFYFLRETKKPPVDLFRQHGVNMAVATDSNPGTAPVESLLLAANMACTFFALTVEEVLKGITTHAAQALGMGDETGTLEAGKRADFTLWDVQEPAELVYRIGVNRCRGVVQNGCGVR